MRVISAAMFLTLGDLVAVPSGASRVFVTFMPAAQVKDGDMIRIDSENRRMDVLDVDESEWQRRRDAWTAPPLKATQGTLYKYIKAVTSASTGCVTDA